MLMYIPRTVSPIAAALVGAAALALTAAPATATIIQQDDFESQTVGATLDATSGDDIANWSTIAGSDGAESNVTIIDSTPGSFTAGQQMDIDPGAADFIFVGTDNSIAAADVQTLAFRADAQLFAGTGGNTAGVLNLTLGLDRGKRYSFVLNADDATTAHSVSLQVVDSDNGGRNERLATVTPPSYNAFDLHTYEIRFTPAAGSARLQAFIDGAQVIDVTDTNPIDFTGDNLIAMFGDGGGRRSVVDNAVFSNVPEPASLALMALGTLAMLPRRPRRASA